MKIPPRLIPLVEDGIIDEVIAQVRSGKEADVFVVSVGGEARCAKVYKEANNRSFRQAVQYQEGRKVQNSRSARALSKRTRYGQKQAEESWITAEVEALNKLSAAGLRVPKPFGFYDGVLIMELIVGEDGEPAPRLDDIALTPEIALLYHEEMISQIVRMLCAGIIHGDLSEFNVLVDAEGPVIIDLPQAVNAAGNNSAAMMFARDVDNMARYFGRFEPGILGLKYAKEIWDLYEKGKLTPHVVLTGEFKEPARKADVGGVLNAIGDARMEHEDRLARKAKRAEPPRGREALERRDVPGEHGRSQGQSHGGHGRPQGPAQGGHARSQGQAHGAPAKSHGQAHGAQGQGQRGPGPQGSRDRSHAPSHGPSQGKSHGGSQAPHPGAGSQRPQGPSRLHGSSHEAQSHGKPQGQPRQPDRAKPDQPKPPANEWGRRAAPGGNKGKRPG
jgi:RIO kinase 1